MNLGNVKKGKGFASVAVAAALVVTSLGVSAAAAEDFGNWMAIGTGACPSGWGCFYNPSPASGVIAYTKDSYYPNNSFADGGAMNDFVSFVYNRGVSNGLCKRSGPDPIGEHL